MTGADSFYETKNLVKRYLTALALTALLIISAYGMTRAIFYQQDSDAPTINLAGRQRMLSLQISKEMLLLWQSKMQALKEKSYQSLRDTVFEWSRVHTGLQNGDPNLRLSGENSIEIKKLVAELEPYYQKLKNGVEKILAREPGYLSRLPSYPTTVRDVMEASPLYLKRMDIIVSQYEKEASARTARLRRLEMYIVLTVLILLALEAVFIFQPMVKKVRKTYKNLQEANDLLVGEITVRKRVEEDLKEHRNLLEQRVGERTYELTKVNRELESEMDERAWAEAALKESEVMYRTLFESANDAIVLADIETGVIIDVNKKTAELLGGTVEEIIGMHVTQIHPEEEAERYGNIFQKAVTRGEGAIRADLSVRHKDGRHIPIEISANNFVLGGQLVRMGTLRDITERRRMERELLKAQKLESLGHLAGGIAHDFNNILMGIQGSISVAKILARNEKKAARVLTRAENAASRGKMLTQQLIAFSRGSMIVKEVLEIPALVSEVVEFALQSSTSAVEFEAAQNLFYVEADPGQISQVINNMVLNAAQAMPEGGVVKVKVQNVTLVDEEAYPLKGGRYVEISIKDTGIGIPLENMDKIFDPYFTTKREGNGLGLTASYTIIKNHGGMIKVRSDTDAGSSFHINLPASDKKITPAGKLNGIISGKGNILYMDDDETIRGVLDIMLTEIGYKSVGVKSGEEAVRIYADTMNSKKRFDAVILDLVTPGGMGGEKTAEKLKEINPKVIIIVSSGYCGCDASKKFMNDGAFIAKPYNVETLSSVLQETVGHA
ncbi:MAG: hypothetical protein IEMM0002_0290 [bacterium]|nr:MAG: hypothetical protein IEMM0002_0290 [bacterium]